MRLQSRSFLALATFTCAVLGLSPLVLSAVPKFTIPDHLREENKETSGSEGASKEEVNSKGMSFQKTGETAPPEDSDTARASDAGGEQAIEMSIEGTPGAQPTDFPSGAVVGQIVDKESGLFIKGVYVVLEPQAMAEEGGESESGELDSLYGNSSESGAFVVEAVPVGTYKMTAIKSGYYEYVITDVKVAEDDLFRLDFALTPKDAISDEVYQLTDFTVTADQVAASRVELMELRQNSVGMVDFLSVEDFAKFGGASLADLVQRLSGVNVVEGQFAVVRGLGDRYNSTLVNDLPMPSPDPLRQGLQLDLFPTSIMESIIANKAFQPYMPSNSSGAAFNLQTKSYPEEFQAWAEFGMSYNENTGDVFLLNGDTPAFRGTPGNDDISLSGVGVADFGNGTKGPLSKDRANLGNEHQAVTMSSVDQTIPYGGQKYNLGFGNTFDLPHGGDIGVVFSASYQSSANTDIGQQQDRFATSSTYVPFVPANNVIPGGFPVFGGGPGSLFNRELGGSALRYDYTRSVAQELTGILFGLGGAIDSEKNHRLDFTYLYAHSGISEALRRDNGFLPAGFATDDTDFGFGRNADGNSLDRGDAIVGRNNGDLYTQGSDSLYFENRTLDGRQFNGEHTFEGVADFNLKWGYTNSNASSRLGDPNPASYVPGQEELYYMRNVSGSTQTESGKTIEPGEYFFLNSSALADNFEAPFLFESARRIDDALEAWRFDVDADLWEGGVLRAGAFSDETERSVVQSDRLSFLSTFTEGGESPQAIWDDRGGASLVTQTINSDSETEREMYDQYMSLDFKIFDQIEVTAGARKTNVRLESQGDALLYPTITLQDVLDNPVAGNPDITNGELIGYTDADAASELDEEYLLPSFTLKYDFLDNWTARAAYGETIALPSMRELSPNISTDTETGDRVFGNPTLQVSELKNYSARLEYSFENGSSFGVSAFYKTIQDPIEQITIVYSGTGDSLQTFFNNPNEAEVKGLELEGRVMLGAIHESLEFFSVSGNLALIDAEVGYPENILLTYFNNLSDPNRVQGPFVGDGPLPFGNDNLPETRRLFDQPEWTANFDITFEHPDWGTRMTLAYYAQSEVLTSVGSGSAQTVDQYSIAYEQFDFSLSQQIGDHWTVDIGIDNITDTTRGLTYSSELVDSPPNRISYQTGRTYSFSATCEW